MCVWPARAVIEPICRLAPVGLNPGLAALWWLNAFAMFLKPILFLFLPSSLCDPPPTFLLVRISSLLKLMLWVSTGLLALRRLSRISCVTQHDAADLSPLPKYGCVKKAGEVLGARSLLSLTDRSLGLDAQFCTAEFFTLGLTCGMCERRGVLWFTALKPQVENFPLLLRIIHNIVGWTYLYMFTLWFYQFEVFNVFSQEDLLCWSYRNIKHVNKTKARWAT